MTLMTATTRPFVLAIALLGALVSAGSAVAQGEFPFGQDLTMEAARQPGSKRLPTLEIGESGEAKLDLWCKSGQGQFSVAGNTVVFVAGSLSERSCSPGLAQTDDDLLAALSDATTWTRQGDLVSFVGSRTLRFRVNSN